MTLLQTKDDRAQLRQKYPEYANNIHQNYEKLIFCSFLFFLCTCHLQAQWNGTSSPWTQGSGTEYDPYLIENANQLAFLAEMVSGGVNTYSGKYFLQTADINLNNLSWIPIGTVDYAFEGNYDGGGYRIDSLFVDNDSYFCKGLFGNASNGSIKNVICEGSITSQTKYQAIIVAKAYNENLINNCAYGSISSFYAMFVDSMYGAGVVGEIKGLSSVKKCVNYADITFTTGYRGFVGGIVGRASNSTPVLECKNEGNISGSFVSTFENTIEDMYVGGIIGSTSNIVYRCCNKGNITVTGAFWFRSDGNYGDLCWIGGISGGFCKVSYCYNVGGLTIINNQPYGHYRSGVV